jgi:hypothetical protein
LLGVANARVAARELVYWSRDRKQRPDREPAQRSGYVSMAREARSTREAATTGLAAG